MIERVELKCDADHPRNIFKPEPLFSVLNAYYDDKVLSAWFLSGSVKVRFPYLSTAFETILKNENSALSPNKRRYIEMVRNLQEELQTSI